MHTRTFIITVSAILLITAILYYSPEFTISECLSSRTVVDVFKKVYGNESKFEVISIFPVKVKKKNIFCGYVVEKDGKDRILVYTDFDMQYLFLGDILDIKEGKFLGKERIDGAGNTK